MFKRFFTLLLVVLMSIESIGAVVSDNDGSAFITKAEFDSLKNNFQSQIDQYNTSIDSKIDGAIASYLAGISMEKKSVLSNLIPAYQAVDNYSIYFADKATAFTNTDNNNFLKGGWWLFWTYGWNIVASQKCGIVNISSGVCNNHRLYIEPETVNSYKYWLKSVNVNGAAVYSPYSSEVLNMNQIVKATRFISTWANSTTHSETGLTTTDGVLDFRNLSTPGSTTVGSYNVGWVNFDNIDGNIELTYGTVNFNNRWHVMNASGECNTTSNNYCVDVDKKYDLTEEIYTNSRFHGSRPGIQAQEFQVADHSVNPNAQVVREGQPNFTVYFKVPKVLTMKNADLANWVTTQSLGIKVPQYAGLPIVKLPGKGKIKFKYKVLHYNLQTASETATASSKIALKSKQFINSTIDNENISDLLFTKSDCLNNEEYTAEFDIEDARSDGSSYLYVKIAPTSNDVYAKIEIVGDIEYTAENQSN